MTITRLGPSAPPAANIPAMIGAMPFWEGVPAKEVADLIANETEWVTFADGKKLTEQEAECDFVYFVLDGQVRLERWRLGPSPQGSSSLGPMVQVMDRTVGKEYLVGRYALIYNLPYTSTATAVGDVTALAFPTSAFERLIYRYPALRGRLIPQSIINRLRTMPLLAGVGLISLSYLAEVVTRVTVANGAHIYTNDQEAKSLFLIERGQVDVFHPRWPDFGRKLGTGNAFGFPGSIGGANGKGMGGSGPQGGPQSGPQSGSQNGSQSSTSNGINHGSGGHSKYDHWAKATTATVLFVLPLEQIRLLSQRYPHVADPAIQDKCFQVVNALSVFANLTAPQKRNLAGYCTFQHIPQHHLIMQQGDIGDSMWVLLEGSRAVLSALSGTNPLPSVPVDGLVYFGEPALVATRNVNSTIESEPGSLWLRFHWRDFDAFVAAEKDPGLRDNLHIRLPDDGAAMSTEEELPWLATGEQLISLTRRHWISLLHKVRFSLVGWVITLLAIIGLQIAQISIGWAIWLLGLPSALWTLWGILDHMNDFFIVTNQRIIQQEKVILTSEYRREALLEQVQNVGVRTTFWGKFFGYGIVSISTAGASGSIDFDFVPEPAGLQASIFRLTAERKARYQAESRLEIQTALEKRLGLTIDLPSRVRSDGLWRKSTDDPTLPWHKRLRRYLTPDNHIQWTSIERIVWHKHWFVLARQVIPLTIFALALLLLMVGGFVFDFYQQVDLLVTQTIFSLELILGILLLTVLAAIAWVVADWWNDTYELTNDRIIDVEKLPLFLAEERKEARLSEIQDIRLDISSPLEMILNYGDIIVQTAASEGSFTFRHVPNPRAVKEEINRRLIEWRRNDERRKARDQMKDLPDWFEMYRRLEAGVEPTRVVQDKEAPKRVRGLS